MSHHEANPGEIRPVVIDELLAEMEADGDIEIQRPPEHSKTPWVWNTYQAVGAKHPVTGEPTQDSGFYVVSPPGFDIARLPITSSMTGEIQGANARFIVKAVNSHDALVAALTYAKEVGYEPSSDQDDSEIATIGVTVGWLREVRDALALAEAV